MNRAFKILSFQAAALVAGGLKMKTDSVVTHPPLSPAATNVRNHNI
jgi:hypothetical protein